MPSRSSQLRGVQESHRTSTLLGFVEAGRQGFGACMAQACLVQAPAHTSAAQSPATPDAVLYGARAACFGGGIKPVPCNEKGLRHGWMTNGTVKPGIQQHQTAHAPQLQAFPDVAEGIAVI